MIIWTSSPFVDRKEPLFVPLQVPNEENLSFKLLRGCLWGRCVERARVGRGIPDSEPSLSKQTVGEVGDLMFNGQQALHGSGGQ